MAITLLILTLLLAVIILIALSIFFRHWVNALLEDYVADGLLSFADNFIGGAGLVGFDIGDWIGAAYIFSKEKKITGFFWALLAAWEATNFLPFSLIPVLGETIETITGLFPCVLILRIFFAKYGSAENELQKLEKLKSIAHENNIGVPDYDRNKIKAMINKDNPIGSLNKSKHVTSEMEKRIKEHIKRELWNTGHSLDEISGRGEQPEDISHAKSLIEEAKKLDKKGDYEKALQTLKDAKNAISSMRG